MLVCLWNELVVVVSFGALNWQCCDCLYSRKEGRKEAQTLAYSTRGGTQKNVAIRGLLTLPFAVCVTFVARLLSFGAARSSQFWVQDAL